MATETATLEETEGKFKNRLNLMDTRIKLLSISGIIPSKNIRSGFWKCRIYRLCQLLSYTLYFAVLTLQVLGLYEYWGDMIIATDNIAVTGTLMIGYVPVLAVLNRPKVVSLIDNLETKSMFCFSSIRSNSKHLEIIQEARSLASRLTWFAVTSLLITIFFWTLYPLVLLMFRSENEYAQSEEDLRVRFQYFVFVMWVPSNAVHSYMYGIIYTLQAIAFSMSLIYLIGLAPLYFSLIIYATAQFKIVSAALTEIDEVSTTLSHKQAKEGMRNFTKMEVGFLGNFNSSEQPKSVLRDKQRDWKNKTVLQAAESCPLRCEVVKQRDSEPRHTSSPRVSTNISTDNGSENDPATLLLVECIKLHQSAIRFTQEVDNSVGQSVFVSCFCVTILLITQTFQLSTVVTTKYVAAFVTSLTQLYAISWFGQGIINQSMAVGQAAYSCAWHQRSTAFRRLILTVLIRARKPLQITLGKLFPLSVELFALILNIWYKMYTVLIEVHES